MFQKSKLRDTGFTITEVIVSAVIFSLAAAGIFATVSSLNQAGGESSQEISAAYIGKQVLEDLRKEIDAATWNTGALGLTADGTCPGAAALNHILSDIPAYAADTITVGSITYTPAYLVECDPDGTSAKRVTMTVTW